MASSAVSNVRPTTADAEPATPAISRLAGVPPALPIRICHVMSADLWAGAEVQLATTAAFLRAQPDVRLSMVLFNEGRLAEELRGLGIDVTVFDERTTNAFSMLTQLRRFLTAKHVDLVHTHRYKDTI